MQQITKLKFDYVNPDIKNFPEQEIRGKVEVLKFIETLLTEEVLERIDKQGFEPANISELLDYAKKDWDKSELVVALSSVWRGLVPDVNGVGGSQAPPALCRGRLVRVLLVRRRPQVGYSDTRNPIT